MTWIDVGRTLSLFIETPDGEKILVNPGAIEPYDSSERLLLPFMAERGIRRLNAVVITRPKPEQAAGIETLVKSIDVSSIVVCQMEPSEEWKLWLSSHPTLRAQNLVGERRFKVGAVTVEVLLASDSFRVEPVLLVGYRGEKFLLGSMISLEVQRKLVEREKILTLVQSRFSPKMRWQDEFVKKFRPRILVEIGPGSSFRPSAPPWKNIQTALPQKTGLFVWPQETGESAPVSTENPDQRETGGEPAGVRPPRHATQIAARRH